MVRTGGLHGYRELVESLGGDAGQLLRQHRLAAQSLADEDALIPLRSLVQLLEASARALRCPDFGLRLARTQQIGILGPLAVAMQHAPTVGEAAACASRFIFVQSSGMAFATVEAGPHSAALRYDITLANLPVARQAVDMALGFAHRVVQLLAGPRYRLLEVHLPHRPLAPPAAYSRFFGAPVCMAQPHAALLVTRATLAAPVRSANAGLQRMAVAYIQAQFPPPEQGIAARVRHAILRGLGTSHARKDGVARLLAMHPRTLQRRLAAEGTSFDAIRDEVSREAALRYLHGTALPLSQVAALVGMARQSALSRACRRWFDQSPSAIRRQGAATGSRE